MKHCLFSADRQTDRQTMSAHRFCVSRRTLSRRLSGDSRSFVDAEARLDKARDIAHLIYTYLLSSTQGSGVAQKDPKTSKVKEKSTTASRGHFLR